MGFVTRAVDSWIEAPHGRTRDRLLIVLLSGLTLGSLLLLSSPVIDRLFGSQRAGSARAATQGVQKPDLAAASRFVSIRMNDLRSDMTLIGTSFAVAGFLRDPTLTTRLAASHDLDAFLAAKAWCRRISLVGDGATLLTASRESAKPACSRLSDVTSELSPGLWLVGHGQDAAGSSASLCLTASLEADAGRGAAVVIEADPALLFAELSAFVPPGASGPYLRDGSGSWLLGPPRNAEQLVSSAAALPSWQGPASGRWDVGFVPGAARGQ